MARTKTGPNKAEARKIEITLAEHTAIASIEWNDGEWTVTHEGGEEYTDGDLEGAIASALEAIAETEEAETEGEGEAEAIAEAEAEAEGDEPVPHSIVPEKYRDEYKARGDASSCGDWIANSLKRWVSSADGKQTHLSKVYAIASANGCDKEWPHLNNGQQRMNAGNAIRRVAKAQGFYIVPQYVTGDGELKQTRDGIEPNA
jgi:hypothetical protein